jgi:hypothetical protein
MKFPIKMVIYLTSRSTAKMVGLTGGVAEYY